MGSDGLRSNSILNHLLLEQSFTKHTVLSIKYISVFFFKMLISVYGEKRNSVLLIFSQKLLIRNVSFPQWYYSWFLLCKYHGHLYLIPSHIFSIIEENEWDTQKLIYDARMSKRNGILIKLKIKNLEAMQELDYIFLRI